MTAANRIARTWPGFTRRVAITKQLPGALGDRLLEIAGYRCGDDGFDMGAVIRAPLRNQTFLDKDIGNNITKADLPTGGPGGIALLRAPNNANGLLLLCAKAAGDDVAVEFVLGGSRALALDPAEADEGLLALASRKSTVAPSLPNLSEPPLRC